MRRRRMNLGLIILLIASLLQIISQSLLPTPPPIGPPGKVLGQQTSLTKVTKVIDGDTIEVSSSSSRIKVRIIGINTPETVDPRREVECFGKEASERARQLLLGKTIVMESDPSQSNKDRYGRVLRYIFLPDGKDFGLIMIQEGYAYEYTYDTPYKYQEIYKKAQMEAEVKKVGLWNDDKCGIEY